MRHVSVLVLLASSACALDLRDAVIVVPSGAPSPVRKAGQMLTEEIAKRTQLRLPIAAPAAGRPAIILKTATGPADGYRIETTASAVTITGNDARGTLFGAGYLLRRLRMERQVLEVTNLNLTSAPKYALRGHQLGYRPKVNAYDGWTPAVYEQYIRDLAVFGTNAIELIPPRSDDDPDSPHFPLRQIDMLEEVSRICNDYGLEVWLWYPALDKDYADPATVEFALKEWAAVYRRLPRIDAIFVPGGDPGHTRPVHLMALLEKQTASLHKFHPKAQMWMSPQSFSAQWMEEWYGIMNRNPAWLSGVVHGPQVRLPLPEFRAKVPARYPLRRYPDITHSRHCQYPVPDWDLAYASTEGRETINPRPTQQATIFHLFEKYSTGFLTYSEGVNDDVNKFIWSGLGWNPAAPVVETLRDYGRYFIGYPHADAFAQGLLALEQNWVGPLAANAGVETTLQQFQELERIATPQMKANWRFQSALYRAYYDAYTRARLLYETTLEKQALDHIRAAARIGANVAAGEAERTLNLALTQPVAQWARARVFELAEALYQSIRMQLSVPRYQAIATDRGANLDAIDIPLNSRGWYLARFAEMRALPDERARLALLNELVNWTNPGPGGFYDDLGNTARQPHLLRGEGFATDPASFRSSFMSYTARGTAESVLQYPRSWWDGAEALYDAPLEMRYVALDPAARYKIRIVYAGDRTDPQIRLATAAGLEIHPLLKRPIPFKPIEFDIPAEATAQGELHLKWFRETGLGDNGRGLHVAEVWLIRK